MSLRHYFVAVLAGLPFTALVITIAFAAMSPPPASQPIEFDHKKHFEYFRAGEHRQSNLKMHEEILEEIPQELIAGDCIECHGEFTEAIEDTPKISSCAGCHEIFLRSDIRERRDIRPCVGCHRNAPNGQAASIPGATVCAACHAEPLTHGHEEQKLGKYIDDSSEIPWVRVHDYLPGDIVFSHERHVMLGEMACQQCHKDVQNSTRPLVHLAELSMDDCIDCHASTNANTDCMVCHR